MKHLIPNPKTVFSMSGKRLIALLLACVSAAGFAQTDQSRSTSYKRDLKIADRLYAESVFYSASEYYKEALRKKPDNRYAMYWLGLSSLMARDYLQAELFLERFFKYKPGPKEKAKKLEKENVQYFSKASLYYGMVLHRNGKYEEALGRLNDFVKTYASAEEGESLRRLAQAEIKGCEFSINAPSSKSKLQLLPEPINGAYTEFAPWPMGENQILYSKINEDTLVFFKGRKAGAASDIYIASKDESGKWTDSKQESLRDEKKYIIGNGAFNKAGNRFYFTKCLEMDDDKALCNLFCATFQNGTFGDVKSLPAPINDPRFTSTQPAVREGQDGQELVYFVSDRPGGKGGYDLWYFIRTRSGDFKGPNVLNAPINSPGDEITPFFDDSTQTLWFSSNGHPGLGGLDVFKVKALPDPGWGEIVNAGKGINSGADDLYYRKPSESETGYLCSNREGSTPLNKILTGSDDIFTVKDFRYAVQGMLYRDGMGGPEPIAGGDYQLYLKKDDGSRTQIIAINNGEKSTYLFSLSPDADYEIEVQKQGYKPGKLSVSTKGIEEEDTLIGNIRLSKGEYIFAGSVFQDGNPNLKLEGAIATIVELGPDGSETIVGIKELDAKSGFAIPLEADKKFRVVMRKPGYFANTYTLSTAGLGNVDSLKKDMALSLIEKNKSYALKNILYDFNKASLTQTAMGVLDTLHQIMTENPTFIIELSSHTDSKGEDNYNMKLSQKRAESCVTYLVSKGIPANRMKAMGYGETKPLVPNQKQDGKDDPDGRALNRRTEFKITGGL